MGRNYLVEYTVGSIFRDAFKIYFGHFGTLFLMYVLPGFPAMVIQQEAQKSGNAILVILTLLLSLIVGGFAYAATTIAVSDVCIGNAPSIKRSYDKILGNTMRLLVTFIIQMLALTVATFLLVIPGLVLLVWFISVGPVVMLEGKSGVAALKRSKQLGDGSHWRNLGYLLLSGLIFSVFLLPFVGVIVAGVVFLPNLINTWIFLTAIDVVYLLPIPFIFILFILVYYDRRVRKEGYDAKVLAEDLAR
jgi:hypothetical protein